MHLEVFSVEPTQAPQHVPTVENAINVISLSLTGDLSKAQPDPAIEGINFENEPA